VKGPTPFSFPSILGFIFLCLEYSVGSDCQEKRRKEQEGTAVHRPEEEKKQDDTLDCHRLIRIVWSGGGGDERIPHDTQLSSFLYVDDKR
jgi:hypothetical protein